MSGEKRSQNWEDNVHEETVIIVDVEGTTTSISFVKDTLFPYVREHLKEYVEKNWDGEEFKADFEKLKEQAQKDENDKVEGFVAIKGSTPEEEKESLIKNVLWQMNADRKTGALKQLQGHIWRDAYNSGTIKGQVYEDVPKAFEEWTKADRKIYVYSSGSVEAQKLLFAHSDHGDMTKYFTDHFDTAVGQKQESSSYKNILAKINAEPSNVMFLTDVVKEAAAAKEAGINAKLVVRPGNAPLTDEDKVTFTTIESFLDLSFQTSAKRKRIEKSEEKEVVKKESSAPEAMDTSESPVTSASEKRTEKNEVSETAPETASTEKTELTEKSDQGSMDVDNKDETEKKNAETVDKTPVVTEQTDKKEEESKTSEKTSKETKEETSTPKESTTNDGEISTSKESVKLPTETTKEATEVKEESNEASVKLAEEEPVVASEPSTEPKSEPKDEQVCTLPSKTETTLTTTITEVKTEVLDKSVESGKTEKKMETEVSGSIESTATISESKTENETEVKSSAKSESSTDPVSESKPEKKEEKEERATNLEKTEQEAPPSKISEPVVESVAQCSAKEENRKEEVKQNGESQEATQLAEKKETNGDLKEEKEVAVCAAAVPVESVKEEALPSEKQHEKLEEKVEKEKKEEETVEAAKTGENAEGKLNGSIGAAETEEKTEAHRNGLNGDSLSEKSNGESQKEAASSSNSQNGQPDTLSSESIKSKKVVDSTIAEGAVEPDVVPPVPVAATS